MHQDGHSPNYDFVIDTAVGLAGTGQGARKILDFGCGRGTLIGIGLKRAPAADFYGADTFDGIYANWREKLPEALRGRIGRIEEGRIPFPDGTFDVVVSNQVFEHIREPARSVAEIVRVLKPGGAFLALFPTADAWFEGHVGIYFAHLLRAPELQRRYLHLLRSMGFGYYKGKRGIAEWAAHMSGVLQNSCFYHRKRDVDRWWREAFGGPPASLAVDYMRYRLQVHPRLRPLAALCEFPPARPLVSFACHKRAGRVMLVRKPA